MITDLQKASLLKRAAAYLLDLILLCILITGLAYGLSVVCDLDSYNERMDALYARYEAEYDISLEISAEEYAALSEEQKANYTRADAAFGQDEEAAYLLGMQLSLTFLISSLSIFAAYFVLEFLIPLRLKNGQTIGKRIFGIALMQTNGVKLCALSLFARTILGKYTLETMIPVFLVLMILFGQLGLTGTLILFLIALLQIIMICVTRTRSAIHDLLASTVAVDMASQKIFDTLDAMLEYKKTLHAAEVERKKY